MRLIDADALIEEARELHIDDFMIVFGMANKQPTAYDTDAVVAELEIEKEKVTTEDYCRTKHYDENDCEHKDCFKCCAEYLIDIVRKGGVDNE